MELGWHIYLFSNLSSSLTKHRGECHYIKGFFLLGSMFMKSVYSLICIGDQSLFYAMFHEWVLCWMSCPAQLGSDFLSVFLLFNKLQVITIIMGAVFCHSSCGVHPPRTILKWNIDSYLNSFYHLSCAWDRGGAVFYLRVRAGYTLNGNLYPFGIFVDIWVHIL